MAMTLGSGEIMVLGGKETPLIRLVHLGWLLENPIFFFLAWLTHIQLVGFYNPTKLQISGPWVILNGSPRQTDLPLVKLYFLPRFSVSAQDSCQRISYLVKSTQKQPRHCDVNFRNLLAAGALSHVSLPTFSMWLFSAGIHLNPSFTIILSHRRPRPAHFSF